jgi:E3 ubiquitin-protein ligase SHPRH
MCIGLYAGVVAAPRQGLSSVPVCTRTSHLLIVSVLYAPGYPSFPINANALQHFSIQAKDKDKAVSPPEKLQGDAIPKSRRKIEYNTIGSSVLAEIDTMEVRGSYGTKIDMLVRHLLYLQLTEAGAKSIVFSAWEDSLHSANYSV